MSVVKLTRADWEDAATLAKDGVAHCGVPSGVTEVSLHYLKEAYLDGTFGYEAYGIWNGKVLNGMALLHRSRYQPCFFVTRVYTWGSKAEHPCLFDLIGEVAEAMAGEDGLTRWYAVNPRWDAACIAGVQYEGAELVVPPHTRPHYSEFFNILMARQIWPEPLTVQRYQTAGAL